jgi:hypothetical protein
LRKPRQSPDALAIRRTAGESAGVTRKRWSDLSPRTRRLIVIVGAYEALLKLAALVDLARRPASEVRGPKRRWAIAIALINSLGLVPLSYFVAGRRRNAA